MKTEARLSARSKRVLVLAVPLAALVSLLVLAEGAVRLRQWLSYGTPTTIEGLYHYDESLKLRVPKAGYHSHTIAINSLGFRGPEIPVVKPQGTTRIAFLGSSTTFCAEVSGNERVWPHLVAQGLAERFPGRKFDYVNGGVPGYGVDSSLRNFQLRVAPLKPDIVVIYDATNDMSHELREIARKRGLLQKAQVEDSSWLGRYSVLWNLVEKNLSIQRELRRAAANDARLSVDYSLLGGRFKEDLTELVVEVKRHAPVVVLATFSYHVRPEQTEQQKLKASVTALYYMPFMTPEGLIESYRQYNRIIEQVAHAQGVVLIDGELEIPGDFEHFNDSVHFTDRGSEAMARRVLHRLASGKVVQEFMTSR